MQASHKPRSAAIYARQSVDHEQGIQDQVGDCRALAEKLGWIVGAVYTDNEQSATSGKPRRAYEAMLADIASGERDGLLFTQSTRLIRRPVELEHFIDVVGPLKLPIQTVRSGEYDLTTADGIFIARQLGILAKRETDLLSERLRRRFQQNAIDGKPHGRCPYGWRRIDGREIADAVEAPVVREIIGRMLAGESVSSVVEWLNNSGIVPPRLGKKDSGDTWTRSTVRQIALRPSNAGLRQHRGEIVGRSQAEPLISEEDYRRLVALIQDPSRQPVKGNRPVHLLSGLAICDLCERPIERQSCADRRNGRTKVPTYLCRHCRPTDDAVARGEASKGSPRAWSIRWHQEPIDRAVEALVVERLSQPDAIGVFAPGADNTDELLTRRRAVEVELDSLTDMLTARTINAKQFARASAAYNAELDQIDAELSSAAPTALSDLVGPDIAKRWGEVPMDRKRAVVRALYEVRIKPRMAGDPPQDGTFRPESIELRPRKPAQ